MEKFGREKNQTLSQKMFGADGGDGNRSVVVVTLARSLVSSGEFSPCRTNNGGCQDLCLPTSDGRVNCSCRGDRQLLEDNTCSRKGETFFFLDEDDERKRLVYVFCLPPTALNMSCGSVDGFECGNGDCINYSLTCDGRAHCKDKSDEKQSYCGECFSSSRFGSFRQFLVASRFVIVASVSF